MVTLSVFEQVMQYPEAVSISELTTSSLDKSESDGTDHWNSPYFLMQYHHLDEWWPWLDWKGAGRFLLLLF